MALIVLQAFRLPTVILAVLPSRFMKPVFSPCSFLSLGITLILITGLSGKETTPLNGQSSHLDLQTDEQDAGGTGGGVSSLFGTSGVDSLVISGADSGTLNDVPFSGISDIDLLGGNDTITILGGGSLSGFLDGGTGSDTLIADDDGSSIVVTGVNSGLLADITGGFSNVENLRGGAGSDSFTFSNFGSLSGGIDGGLGVNVLNGNNSGNSFSITGAGSGIFTSLGDGFTNIETLNGGTANDSFSFSDFGWLSGGIDGRQGTDDITADSDVVLTGMNTGSLTDFSGTFFSNIESYIGSQNTVDGTAAADNFDITGADELDASK